MTKDRDVTLNVRVRAEERAKLRALADDRDLSISAVIRHFIRKAHAARFGTTVYDKGEPQGKRGRS